MLFCILKYTFAICNDAFILILIDGTFMSMYRVGSMLHHLAQLVCQHCQYPISQNQSQPNPIQVWFAKGWVTL